MNLDELFVRADKAYDEGDFETAFRLFTQGAVNGDTSAMESLANMYTSGAGIPHCDYDVALQWELKAFELGNSLVAANIGVTYRIRGNIKKAKEWFEKAVEAGDDDAALELAKLYMVSDKETDNIRKYLSIAANGNNVCEASREEAKALLKQYDNG